MSTNKKSSNVKSIENGSKEMLPAPQNSNREQPKVLQPSKPKLNHCKGISSCIFLVFWITIITKRACDYYNRTKNASPIFEVMKYNNEHVFHVNLVDQNPDYNDYFYQGQNTLQTLNFWRAFARKPYYINNIYEGGKKYKVCAPESYRSMCLTLERNSAQAECNTIESRIDCALKIARGEADFGVFTEEEILLLASHKPNESRVIATIRDETRNVPYAFEAVAVVPATYAGGFDNLKNGKFCHPGFDSTEQRWSPRVLKTFERAVAKSDRCPGVDTKGKSADELEVEVLNEFFSAACRPGPWSANETVDAALKQKYPNLCSLCSTNSNNNSCNGYNIDMGVSVAGVNNQNRHIQALECMRNNGEGAVAYVAWQHVRDYFTIKQGENANLYALLCEDGNVRQLTLDILQSTSAPCAFVRQPWSTIVASTQTAAALSSALKEWWPQGKPGGTWQTSLFNTLATEANARVIFEDNIVSPAEYTANIRTIPSIDSTTSCVPARRWCTINALELEKCNWLRASAHVLGIQPALTCAVRDNVFQCLQDIRDNQLDLFVSSSNYGYLARQHYNLSPVKLVQNRRNDTTRVVALVKNSAAETSITRFESLRNSKACFPEFGGIAYMSFVKVAQNSGVISAQECDYARAVGEFFDGACAGGAVDASHALSDSSDFNSTTLCSVCRPAQWATPTNNTNDSNAFTCAWNSSNMYFGNNGSLACLNDPQTQLAVLPTHNIEDHLRDLKLEATSFRALCRNNTLAATPGVNVDDGCLLAQLTDAELVTRRNDPNLNALNVLLDTLELHFGYAAESVAQHINLEMYSPLDGNPDLLFKDTAIGLLEPSASVSNEYASNYIELFKHLESCTGAAPGPSPGDAARHLMSALSLALMAIMTKFIIN